MPSSLWFELRDSGCLSSSRCREYEREARLNQRDYYEARNGCHELHTALNNLRDSNNSKNDKEEKDK